MNLTVILQLRILHHPEVRATSTSCQLDAHGDSIRGATHSVKRTGVIRNLRVAGILS